MTTTQRVPVPGAEIELDRDGTGSPVLLLHGYPQTRRCWRQVAARLAERHEVVAADLRGYGGSSAPPDDPDHTAYAKRTMAADMLAAMAALGHDRFAVVGHDRGARVAYRLALDSPAAVTRLAVLDVVPTAELWRAMDAEQAMKSYHWLFLAQPDGLPELLLRGHEAAYVREVLRRWAAPGFRFDPAAVEEYVRRFRVAPSCADYRAGATVDRAHDEADLRAGRRIGARSSRCGGAAPMPASATCCRCGGAGPTTSPGTAWPAGTSCRRRRPTRWPGSCSPSSTHEWRLAPRPIKQLWLAAQPLLL